MNMLTLAGLFATISADKAANICRCTVKLLTLAVFGVAGPGVTNRLILAGLWTLFGYKKG